MTIPARRFRSLGGVITAYITLRHCKCQIRNVKYKPRTINHCLVSNSRLKQNILSGHSQRRPTIPEEHTILGWQCKQWLKNSDEIFLEAGHALGHRYFIGF